MKLPRLIVFCVALAFYALINLAVELRAARSSLPVMVKPQLQSLTATPLFDDDGKLKSMKVSAVYLVETLNPDGVTRTKDLRHIDVDLVTEGKQRVIVGREILEMDDFKDDLLTMADGIWLHRFPAQLPTPRRKDLREPGTAK